MANDVHKLKRKQKRAARKRNNYRRIANKRNARLDDELYPALNGAHKERKDCRRQRRRLKGRIERREDKGKSHEWADAKREDLADQIEDIESLIDQLVDRIDQLEVRTDKAERLHKFYRRRVQKLRRKRKAIQQQAAGQLTDHFHIREFDCHEGDPVPRYMEPHLKDLCERVLEPMRREFGPAHVNSGHRWTWYNAKIGGASQSFHCYEVRKNQPAADLTFARGTPAQWAAFARKLGVGGVGQYATFVHVDTGPRRDWWG